ncbi:unnamed protein product [Paramecium primaurelia]|uniref:Uncharacterized protein n=1 Tax=Paramecium primaurelia TaxID=5886 RepID=A0A8S1PT36_PARPR|nr:unnamed protein product [Paramecium primaurelia]
MYCFFQTSTIQKRSFLELNLQLYPEEIQALQNGEQMRNQIIQGNFQIIPHYLQFFHQSLKPILNKQSHFHPQFIYNPIVSNQYLRSPENSQEAFEIDYVMLLYTYCNGQLHDSYIQIKNIRQALIEDKLPNPKDVDIILDKMKVAYTLIKNTQTYSNQLLPNLSLQRTSNYPEFSSIFFLRYSTYYVVMANLFYFEKMQDMKNEKVLIIRQNLCSTMLKNLIKFVDLGNDKLGIYLCYISFYFKCLGYKSIIEKYLYYIQKDDYRYKSFTVMTLEIIELSKELKQLCEKILLQQNLNEIDLEVFKIQAARWITFSDCQINAYTGIITNPQQIQTNESILLNSDNFNCLD